MAEPRIDGCVQFHIAVPQQEMRRWPAAAITEFFNGLAQIVFAAGDAATIEIATTDTDSTKERMRDGPTPAPDKC